MIQVGHNLEHSAAIYKKFNQTLTPDFMDKKLSDLVRGRNDLFQTEDRSTVDGTNKVLYLRAKVS